MKAQDLIIFAKGGQLSPSKIRILAIKDGRPSIIKEKPNSEPLTICVCSNAGEKELFPAEPLTIYVPDMSDAMELINI